MSITLLEVVQDVLSDLNSDEVTSITDTVEAQQVVKIAHRKYIELLERDDYRHLCKNQITGALTEEGTTTYPTTFELSSTYRSISNIRYDITETGDTNKTMRTIIYKTPDEFNTIIHGRKTGATDVDDKLIKGTGGQLWVINDKWPLYWTSYDDIYVTLDAYLTTENTILETDRMYCDAILEPVWTESNTFNLTTTGNLPAKLIGTYLSTVKAASFKKLKELVSEEDERHGRIGIARLRRENRSLQGEPLDKKNKGGYGRR